MAEQVGPTRRDLESQLIERAWRDEAFAQELRSNPKAALEREVGRLPENIQVKVLEETPTTLYLVLPSRSAAPQGELSDADLEAVAAGTGCAADSWLGP